MFLIVFYCLPNLFNLWHQTTHEIVIAEMNTEGKWELSAFEL